MREEQDRKGAIEDPPTGTMSPGWVPLAHAKGRQETGAGGASLSVDGGDPGPGRRLRGEGLGPESTSGLSPPPGFRTTGVGVPRPRPPPHTHPGACSPEATSGPRPRPRSRGRRRRGLPAAARFGSASPPPPPDTKPVRGPARPRGPSSPPRAPEGGFVGPGNTTEAARLFLLLLLALLPLLSPLSPRPRREARKRSGDGEGFAGFPLYYFFFVLPPHPGRSPARTLRRRHLRARHYGGRGLASGERPHSGVS
uniref:basic proline-rich protein-like n=1 Tax=Arvicanthis niloticus TaxID=61156 RepID=UPI0014875F88|nr:basic proline-rich protein-like [Arvicanthis niloticus]